MRHLLGEEHTFNIINNEIIINQKNIQNVICCITPISKL